MRSRPSQYALLHHIFILPHYAGALSSKSAVALTMAGEAEMAPRVLLQLA
jgi:hypothetical protein